MFLWKNAIVLIGLLGLTSLAAIRGVRTPWEMAYFKKLVICAATIVLFAVSFVPMLATQFIYALLMVICFDRRTPIAATYFFFFFWTPAAGSLLDIGGSYIAPLTPFLSFSGALLVGYLLRPEDHLRRPFLASDAYVLLFLLTLCICMSVDEKPTGIIRTFATYCIPYVLSYFILSRVRLQNAELVLRLLVFGAAAGGILCIFETLKHWPLYAGLGPLKREGWMVDTPGISLIRGGILRSYGPYAHPLSGGALLGLAAIAAWGWWQIRGRSLPVVALTAAIVIGAIATLSRSGFIALAVGLATFQLLRGRYLLAVFVPLAGVAGVFVLPILSGADAQFSTSYRLGLILGVPKALGHHVWFGYRGAADSGLLDAFIQGQGIVDLVNTYVALIVQGGVVSLALFVILILSSYKHYLVIRRSKPDANQLILAQVLISMQTALIVALALLNSWSAPMQLSLLIIAILVALRIEVSRPRSPEQVQPRRRASPDILPQVEADRLPALR